MADTKIGIDVQASTGAAVSQLGKLNAEIRQSTDAADAAGKAQKGLGKEVSETRARQIEATEAIRRAKQAQQEHTQTLQSFGKGSAQARASQDQLTKATNEAKKASVAAAQALENTAKAATEAAKAEGDKLTPATKRLASQLVDMGKDAERSAFELRKMDLAAISASKGTSTLGKNLTALHVAGGNLLSAGVSKVISGIGDALGYSVTSAIGFESSMADVAKVVDGLKSPTGELTAEYHKMTEELFSLSERIAVTPEGLARIAAAAGQSGIAGAELTRFAEDAAKTSVAFGITAEQSGTGLAKLRTGLNLTQDQVMSLSGTMNHLSNSMASEAGELLDAVQRVGSIGKAANVSGQEIAALSSAMISAGAGAEMAATGTKNFLLALAAGESATLAQRHAYKSLGLDAEKVAKNVTSQDMIVRATQMKEVIAKLAGVADDKRISTMKQLFGSETVGTIGPLATNLDLLSQSLELAADKTAAASSVQAEFESRSNTTENTLQLLKNTLSVTAIKIGTDLLPEISKMAKELSAWVQENRELIKTKVIDFIHGAVDALKGLGTFLGKAVDLFTMLTDKIGGTGVALGAMGIAVSALAGPWVALGAVAIGVLDSILDEIPEVRLAMEEFGAEMFGALGAMQQAQKIIDDARRKKRDDDDTKDIDKNLNTPKGPTMAYGHAPAAALPPGMNADGTPKDGGGSKSGGGGGGKKTKTKKEKDQNAFARDMMDFDADLANFTFKLAKKLREEDIKDQEEAYQKAADLQDRQILGMDREIEALEARGIAESQKIDLIFYTIEIESEAEMQRQRMMDDRMNREVRYARWQVKNAKSEKQREEAQTKLEAVEHKKRIAALQKAQRAEQAAYEKKLEVVNRVTGGITTVTDAMVEGAWKAAEGQKGALWYIVAEELKAVAKRYSIKAAAEFASAAIAAAGVVTAPLAAGHLAAGVAATGVALLAGGGAFVANKIGDARSGGGGKKEKGKGKYDEGGEGVDLGGGISPRSGSSSDEGGDDDGIPTSYVERSNFSKRNQATSPKKGMGGSVTNITVNGTFLGGTQEQVYTSLQRGLANVQSSKGKTR